MTVILYTEINIVCIAVLLVLYFSRRRTASTTLDQRLFDYLILSLVGMFVLDTGMWMSDARTFPGAWTVNYTMSALYYLFQPLPGFLWLLYSDCMVLADERGMRRRMIWYAVPLLITFLMIVTNQWTGWAFTVDANNVYRRGSQFLVISMLVYLYMALSAFYAVRHARRVRRAADRREDYYIAAFPMPAIVCAILQTMYYGLSLVWVGTMLAVLIMFANVQNSQIATDPLTGLYNRRQLVRHMDWVTSAHRKDGRLFTVMMDVDDFKKINDGMGHAAGDRALQTIAGHLRAAFDGRDDFLSRMGGDEFAVLCERPDEDALRASLRALDNLLRDENAAHPDRLPLSVSCGWAAFGENGIKTPDALLSAADVSMYANKQRKKASR